MAVPDTERKVAQLRNEVDSIYEILTRLERTQNRQATRLDQIAHVQQTQGEVLDHHSEVLDHHSQVLDHHSQVLDHHSQVLDHHSEVLASHGEKLDTILELLRGGNRPEGDR
jgi:flagellar biosynthesis chaperone FliJ